MTLYEFKLLDETIQEKTLWENGSQIIHRFDKNFTTIVYQINSFYIELKYDAGFKEIVEYRSFENSIQLESHLNKIGISNLKKVS